MDKGNSGAVFSKTNVSMTVSRRVLGKSDLPKMRVHLEFQAKGIA